MPERPKVEQVKSSILKTNEEIINRPTDSKKEARVNVRVPAADYVLLSKFAQENQRSISDATRLILHNFLTGRDEESK